MEKAWVALPEVGICTVALAKLLLNPNAKRWALTTERLSMAFETFKTSNFLTKREPPEPWVSVSKRAIWNLLYHAGFGNFQTPSGVLSLWG